MDVKVTVKWGLRRRIIFRRAGKKGHLYLLTMRLSKTELLWEICFTAQFAFPRLKLLGIDRTDWQLGPVKRELNKLWEEWSLFSKNSLIHWLPSRKHNAKGSTQDIACANAVTFVTMGARSHQHPGYLYMSLLTTIPHQDHSGNNVPINGVEVLATCAIWGRGSEKGASRHQQIAAIKVCRALSLHWKKTPLRPGELPPTLPKGEIL